MNGNIYGEIIGISLFVIVIFSFSFLVFFIVSRNRQNSMFIEKINQQKFFENQLLRSQLEIQEETSEHISREIHDDVGQVLSVARIYLQGVEQNEKIIKTSELISKAIATLRNISHSLNASQILHTGIVNALETELKQIEESGRLNVLFSNKVESFKIKPDRELILFRTCQEALNNAIKHSEAKLISILITENDISYSVKISDDGKGFDFDEEQNKISKNGLKNMKKRMELIGAKMEIKTKPGTTITIYINKDHV